MKVFLLLTNNSFKIFSTASTFGNLNVIGVGWERGDALETKFSRKNQTSFSEARTTREKWLPFFTHSHIIVVFCSMRY